MEEQAKKPDTLESIYIQALRRCEECATLQVTRQSFLECFLILFIINDFVKESNAFYAEKYMCSEKSIERYFSDLRASGIIYQKINKPFYEGSYHTERVMWLNPILKSKIIGYAKEIKGERR